MSYVSGIPNIKVQKLLVEFGKLDIAKRFYIYLEALDAYREIFRFKADLVMRAAVKNKVIAGEINRTKKLLYGA